MNLIEIPTSGKKRELIVSMLLSFGFEYRYSGTRFIDDMIDTVLTVRSNVPAIKLYKMVAAKHETTWQNVEKCSRWMLTRIMRKNGPAILDALHPCANIEHESIFSLSEFIYDAAASIMLRF